LPATRIARSAPTIGGCSAAPATRSAFSLLNQIKKQNVSRLRLAWCRGMGPGTTGTIPTVHDGIL
jgi:hypothetical protein